MTSPGPWTLSFEDGGHEIFDAEQYYVAGVDHASQENARLIAAAPMLLDACEKAMELQPVHAMKYLLEAVRIAKGL